MVQAVLLKKIKLERTKHKLVLDNMRIFLLVALLQTLTLPRYLVSLLSSMGNMNLLQMKRMMMVTILTFQVLTSPFS